MYNFSDLVSKSYDEAKIADLSRSAFDPSFWALKNLDLDLYDNQISVVKEVCDLSSKYLAILAARGSGKSFACALGIVKLCLDYPGLKVGIFGPKSDQASRLIKEEITRNLIRPGTPVYSFVDWSNTSSAHVHFNNGSDIIALSASEYANIEGHHFGVILIDECHQVSDLSVSQRISPMMGSHTIAKLIKIGIASGRNNFWQSCASPNTAFKLISHDWTQCPILLIQGSIIYNGMELPKHVVDVMPITLKRKYFPDRLDLHYDSVIGLTEVDFNSQYAMIWENDANLVLSEEHQRRLVSGDFDILEKAQKEKMDKYFFGLDTATGSILLGKKDLDYTALSIWRRTHDNICQKVAAFEWRGVEPIQLMDEIISIIHPQTGVFPCVVGCADFSNVAVTFVDVMNKEKIPVIPISFGAKEETTGKNYKNATFFQFVFELECGRVQFPSLEKIEKDPVFYKSFQEWCLIEKHQKQGINFQISAPPDMHDDSCSADVLSVWAATRAESYKGAFISKPMVMPLAGPDSVASRGIPNPTGDQNKSRFLQ